MTDGRDPKVSRRYRELGADEPSRELDQTILAAAHRAADRPHAPLVTPAGRHRWYFAFGAVAILVLAVAVTVQVERQQPDPEALPAAPPAAVRSDREERFSFSREQQKEGKRAQAEKQVEPAKPLADANRARAPAAEPRREFAQDPAPSLQEAAPAASAPAQPSADAQTGSVQAPSAKADSPRGAPSAEQDRVARRAMERAQAPVAASSLALNPERLLERIAELRKEGRHDEADKLLAEFRQRHPDYRISEEMLQKVERRK
jgi:hypothetical protein